ncbi:MAG: C25 family cysteine peptidase [Promethearchaeota archaeon]
MKKPNSLRRRSSIILLLILFFPSMLTLSQTFNENDKPVVASTILLNSYNSTLNLTHLPDINQISWSNPKTEMLIITPNDSQYIDAVEPLKEWRDSIGVKTQILSNFSEYDGVDTAEKIRNMIKEFYEKENIRWVLLAGDAEESLIPIRYVYNPDTIEYDGTEHSSWNEYYKPTDFYYSALAGTWDQDGDGDFGESEDYNGNGIDEITWVPDVYVGRLPASNPTELADMINKTLKYESDPYLGDWMNQMLLAGGISSYSPPEDEARLMENIWQNYTISEMNFTHLAKTTSNFTPSVPPAPNSLGDLTITSFRNEFNSGYSTVIIAGHADPSQIKDESSLPPPGNYYNSGDASSSSNLNMPSLFYADACTTSSYDVGDSSIGEILIKQMNSGAIGFIGGLRVTWYLENDYYLEKLNRGNAKMFWEQFFAEKKFRQGQALFDSKVAYLESDYFTGDRDDRSSIRYEYERKNLLSYSLLGDPIIDIYTKEPTNTQNPFTDYYFSGQMINTSIKNIHSKPVPYARVHFKSSNGSYHTEYADKNGQVIIRLPDRPYENYSVVITGHNLIPSNFTFSTIPDIIQPEIMDVNSFPIEPTVSDNMQFDVRLNDNESGIESLFLLISTNNMTTYEFYQYLNSWDQNRNRFSFTLNKLQPGEYIMIFVARDYCNNTVIGNQIISFKIEPPLSFVPIVVLSTVIVFLFGISCVVVFRSLRRNKKVDLAF